MDALTTTHNAAVHIIDTSIVRVHQQGACVADNRGQHMGRSRGELTSKIHAIVWILPLWSIGAPMHRVGPWGAFTGSPSASWNMQTFGDA